MKSEKQRESKAVPMKGQTERPAPEAAGESQHHILYY